MCQHLQPPFTGICPVWVNDPANQDSHTVCAQRLRQLNDSSCISNGGKGFSSLGRLPQTLVADTEYIQDFLKLLRESMPKLKSCFKHLNSDLVINNNDHLNNRLKFSLRNSHSKVAYTVRAHSAVLSGLVLITQQRDTEEVPCPARKSSPSAPS